MKKFNTLYERVLLALLEDIANVFWLAKVASKEGVDLTGLNRTQYIDYAEKHNVTLDSSNIRMAPQLRVAIDSEHYQQIADTNKLTNDKNTRRFYRMSAEHQASPDKILYPGIVVHPQTTSNPMWLYYEINGGLENYHGTISKSYIGLKNVNNFQPQDWVNFLRKLQDNSFAGCVKTAQDPNTIKDTSDQIVMHGNSKEDAEIGLRVAKEHFGDKVGFEDVGQDVERDGEWYSHTQNLQIQHQQRMQNKKFRFTPTN